MDWERLTAIAALLAVVVAIPKLFLETRQLRREHQRLEESHAAELSAEHAARKLLECTRFRRRTFEALSYHLGGYNDDDLRRLLIRAGAVRFKEDKETWGPIERNQEALEDEKFTRLF